MFLLALVLGKHGEGLWSHVGREPSGTAFNSIVQLERERGMQRNPFINAGAIVLTDLVLAGHTPREAIGEMVRFVRFLAGSDVGRPAIVTHLCRGAPIPADGCGSAR